MQELFLNKELSLLAKEKGFDESCFAYHTDKELNLFADIKGTDTRNSTFQFYPTAPLYQQIIDWFEAKGISVEIFWVFTGGWRFSIKPINKEGGKLLAARGYKIFCKEEEPTDFNTVHQSKIDCCNKAIEEAFKLI